jgi:fucose 4-O-acetylase-like acetyltransferase
MALANEATRSAPPPSSPGDRDIGLISGQSFVPSSARIEWIDAARGIGIILVVFGHILTKPLYGLDISYAIFTFHMPLFIFLSAMVLKDADWKTVARTRFRSLLIPYFVYVLLVGIPLTIATLPEGLAATAKFGARLFLGGGFFFTELGPFWYVPTFFVSVVIYSALRRRLQGDGTPAFVAVMAITLLAAYIVSALRISLPIPYCLHVVPAMVFLIWVGRRIPWQTLLSPPWLLASIAVIIACIALDSRTATPSFAMDLKGGLLGTPILGILLAIAGSHICFVISDALSRQKNISKVLALIGRNTLPLLFLHQSVHYALLAIGVDNQYLVAMIAIMLPCVFAYMVAHSIPRFAWLFGVSLPIAPASTSTPRMG